MGAALTPEELNALVQSGVLDAQQPLLERQLATASALRGQKRAERSTPTGNILSGFGGLITNASGAIQENDFQQQLAALAQKRGEAEAPGRRLQALLAQQKLAAGDLDLEAGRFGLDTKKAEEARAGAPIAPEVESLLSPLAPGAKLKALTNRDLGAATDLAKSGASVRQAGLDRAESRAQRKAAQDAAGQKRAADTEEGLRKEVMGNPVTKAMQEVAAGYDRVKFAVANPSAAGDMALVFGYVKLLDPGSTVREGEAASAEKAQGVPSQVLNVYNKVVKGERLPPEVREDFLRQSHGLYGAQLNRYNAIAQAYRGLATGSGVDPSRVVVEMGLGAPTPTAGAPAGPTHYLISPDGKQRVPADAQGKPLGPPEPNPGG